MIPVTCACGHAFQVTADPIPESVACPHCKNNVTVDDETITQWLASKAASVTKESVATTDMTCPCGHTYLFATGKVPPQVTCPDCGRQTVVDDSVISRVLERRSEAAKSVAMPEKKGIVLQRNSTFEGNRDETPTKPETFESTASLGSELRSDDISPVILVEPFEDYGTDEPDVRDWTCSWFMRLVDGCKRCTTCRTPVAKVCIANSISDRSFANRVDLRFNSKTVCPGCTPVRCQVAGCRKRARTGWRHTLQIGKSGIGGLLSSIMFVFLFDNAAGWLMGGRGSSLRNDSLLCRDHQQAAFWRGFVRTFGILLLIPWILLVIGLHNPDPAAVDAGPGVWAPDLWIQDFIYSTDLPFFAAKLGFIIYVGLLVVAGVYFKITLRRNSLFRLEFRQGRTLHKDTYV